MQLGKPRAHVRGNKGDAGKGEVNRVMSNLSGIMSKEFHLLPNGSMRLCSAMLRNLHISCRKEGMV